MTLKKRILWKITLRILMAFGIAGLAEIAIITFMGTYPIIVLKLQGLLGVSLIAYLVCNAYKIWTLYNLDHPLTKNGKDKP